MHLVLSPYDADAVLMAGWAERHPLSRGGWFERFVPATFVMIYAPRDEEEIQSVLRIIRAAAWFVEGETGPIEQNLMGRQNWCCSAGALATHDSEA